MEQKERLEKLVNELDPKAIFHLGKLMEINANLEKQLDDYKLSPLRKERIVAEREELIAWLKKIEGVMALLITDNKLLTKSQ